MMGARPRSNCRRPCCSCSENLKRKLKTLVQQQHNDTKHEFSEQRKDDQAKLRMLITTENILGLIVCSVPRVVVRPCTQSFGPNYRNLIHVVLLEILGNRGVRESPSAFPFNTIPFPCQPNVSSHFHLFPI